MTGMEQVYLAALGAVPGLSRKRVRSLMPAFASARDFYEAPVDQLQGLLHEKEIAALVGHRRGKQLEDIAKLAAEPNTQLISIYDAEYPELLWRISDPPLVLYVRGQLPQGPALAVVGSRKASAYGERVAHSFSMALSMAGFTIISGGARGIDSVAHEAALSCGGQTVAVLGCGLDIAYPRENKELFAAISEQGAVVSEYPPGTEPIAFNFPARNRIIVGLSQGVLVAEAAQRSGALITAHIAADEGRDVFCVPGDIFLGKSIGCHELIRSGALLVDSPQMIIEEHRSWQQVVRQPNLFSEAWQSPGAAENKPSKEKIELEGTKAQIFQALGKEPLSMEALMNLLQLDYGQLTIELVELQMEGLIDQDYLQRYYRL